MKFHHARARKGLPIARVIRKGVMLAALASLAAVPSAGAATYPVEGGNGFQSGAEGWTGVTAECNALLLGSICQTQNVHSPSQGNPAGSLESTTAVLVNAGGLFVGESTWRSPSFTATAEGRGTLEYDRHQTTAGLASLGSDQHDRVGAGEPDHGPGEVA